MVKRSKVKGKYTINKIIKKLEIFKCETKNIELTYII